MGEYTLTPHEQPPWRFAANDFAVRIRQRWRHARTGIGDLPGSPMLLENLSFETMTYCPLLWARRASLEPTLRSVCGT